MSLPPTPGRLAARRSSPSARLARVSAVAASLMFVTFLTMTTSRSAFSSATSNTGNSVASGSVVLGDDDSGSAMFNVSNATPGAITPKCITVSYTGTSTPPAAVRLYRNAANTGTGLDTYLDLTIEVGTGGSFSSCSGFSATSTLYTGTVANFASSYTGYGASLSTGWTPTPSSSRTFRYSLSLQNDNAAQGKNATFGYTWEVQSS